jgi:Dolichyl-phosphate-mannose-protein mannosyltransferase
MERASTVSTRTVLALLAALVAFNVYRAATRDVTPAEAWNYDRYVGVTWEESLRHFDLNNHVFISLLERISTKRFHLTELSLRLPGLVGGLLYLWAVFRLCRRWFVPGVEFAAAVAVMVLHPWVIDALSQARGYGFAMAFWLLALDLLLQCMQESNGRKLNWAAIWLALSVASCLAFIVPVLGLLATFKWRVRRPLARDLIVPLLVFLFVLLAIPLNRVLLSDFAVGANRWPVSTWLLGSAVFAVVFLAVRRRDSLTPLAGGTVLAALAILFLAHRFLSARFPEEGAIYFVPLLTLAGLGTLRGARRLLILAASVVCLIYIAQFPAGPYREGRQFAGSREIAKTLRAAVGQRAARIATSLDLEPVMNYYRTRYRQGNWDRIERKALTGGYDFYVLTSADRTWVDRLGLRVVAHTPGIILAAR